MDGTESCVTLTITCGRCSQEFSSATAEQYHNCPAVYARVVEETTRRRRP